MSEISSSQQVATLKNVLEAAQKQKTSLLISNTDSESIAQRNKEEREERKAVRRFFHLYQILESTNEQDHYSNQLYGQQFSSYRDLTGKQQTSIKIKQLSKLIFEGLYVRNTGFMYGNNGENQSLPLTLRRDKSSFQSVMLVLGDIDKRQLEVFQNSLDQAFEDILNRQQLVLKVKDKDFVLTYPLIAYFDKLRLGDISCDNNPSLTHGIAALDALLIEKFAFPHQNDSSDVVLMYRTTKGQEQRSFYFEGGMLFLD